ncbi:GIY-YIG nuclease family protein [Thalassotalea sp. G2M2-11]|uniref:GIY-YIG nuclease family protein n=1 Tax=Thalassotalea sp. G2M2-11 TaxID=2787627 RepID=UPI0019D260EC|nr:GIY-YIG nuclease family protein [Thalassotalea sp. G2M2-11]
MTNAQTSSCDNSVTTGNVYVMTHSLFTDVVRIGCTPESPDQYAQKLSENSPGQYTLVFSLACQNPCQVKKQIRAYLDAQKYVNEFYQVSPTLVKKLVQQETLRIPIFDK